MTVVAASISGAFESLSLVTPPLSILGGTGDASGIDPGQVQFNRVWATSPYVAGGVNTLTVAGVVAATFQVWVKSTSQLSDLDYIALLIEAFTQQTYTLTLVLDSATYEWNCYCADYDIGKFPVISVIGLAYLCTFVVPRSPIPVLGPI